MFFSSLLILIKRRLNDLKYCFDLFMILLSTNRGLMQNGDWRTIFNDNFVNFEKEKKFMKNFFSLFTKIKI